ncbi:hypothetical protein SAMN05443545_103425 [Aidingimonas halophila]|uniref:Uncharacterized protein n=1 Tax=Aidingimonas halophila TaxID=574349 RepID=A0A1H2YCC6_9GAMM|nr:hypothetical protein SAMN05443545_103425 [Aidingimonas halophila]
MVKNHGGFCMTSLKVNAPAVEARKGTLLSLVAGA